MQTLNLATPGRVTGAMPAVGRVDPAVEQVFVAAAGNAQARGAQYLIWLVAVNWSAVKRCAFQSGTRICSERHSSVCPAHRRSGARMPPLALGLSACIRARLAAGLSASTTGCPDLSSTPQPAPSELQFIESPPRA